MYGIQQIGDDTGQVYHLPTKLERNTCVQQKETAKLVKNSSSYANVTYITPYQNVNLQVLPTLKPILLKENNDKDKKVLQILIEKKILGEERQK